MDLARKAQSLGFEVQECLCTNHPESHREVILTHPQFPNCKAAIEYCVEFRDPLRDGNEGCQYTLEALEYQSHCYLFQFDELAEDFVLFNKENFDWVLTGVLRDFDRCEAQKGKGYSIFSMMQEIRDEQRIKGLKEV